LVKNEKMKKYQTSSSSHDKKKLVIEDEFQLKMNKLPAINIDPGLAIIWDGSESEMHLQPWKFGHALGRNGGRRSCLKWFYETENNLGCFAGME